MQGEDIQKNPEKEDSGDGERSKNVVRDSQVPDSQVPDHRRKEYVNVSTSTGCMYAASISTVDDVYMFNCAHLEGGDLYVG
jgi:hypothetical protein